MLAGSCSSFGTLSTLTSSSINDGRSGFYIKNNIMNIHLGTSKAKYELHHLGIHHHDYIIILPIMLASTGGGIVTSPVAIYFSVVMR